MTAISLPSLDFDLDDTTKLLRDTIRDFAATEIAPRAADIYRDDLAERRLGGYFGIDIVRVEIVHRVTPVADHRGVHDISCDLRLASAVQVRAQL